MKKLFILGAVLALLCVGIGAHAYEFVLGQTTYGDIAPGYGPAGQVFLYQQDGDPGAVFNFALSTDPHFWDYGYAGDKTTYSGHHLFQSSLDQFKISIELNTGYNADAWDRDNVANTITPVTGCAWAISSPGWNSPLRGTSITDFVLNADGTFSGNLVSDGLVHWASSANTTDLTLCDYQDTFRFVGSQSTGSLTVYAKTVTDPAVPEPMSIMLGIMGLGSVAGFRKLRGK